MTTLELMYKPTFSMAHLQSIVSPAVAILLSVLSGVVIFRFFDVSIVDGLYYFYVDPVRDAYGVSELLLKVSPILLCAYGLLFCFKAGVWNIGAEGQYISGAILAGWAALSLEQFDSRLNVFGVLLAGVLGGMACAAIVGFLKYFLRVSELLTTIMLNYVAVHVLMYLVNGPLKDPNGFSFPESAIFADHTLLPVFTEAFRLNVSIFFPVVLLAVCFLVFNYTRFGFELGVSGGSASAAKNAGIDANKHALLVLVICGMCAGLAGAAEVIGPVGQLIPQLSVGYGYTAIICVYLGRMDPFGVAVGAVLMGLTVVGAESLQLQYDLPSVIAAVFQGLVLFYLLAADFLASRLLARQAV